MKGCRSEFFTVQYQFTLRHAFSPTVAVTKLALWLQWYLRSQFSYSLVVSIILNDDS